MHGGVHALPGGCTYNFTP